MGAWDTGFRDNDFYCDYADSILRTSTNYILEKAAYYIPDKSEFYEDAYDRILDIMVGHLKAAVVLDGEIGLLDEHIVELAEYLVNNVEKYTGSDWRVPEKRHAEVVQNVGYISEILAQYKKQQENYAELVGLID